MASTTRGNLFRALSSAIGVYYHLPPSASSEGGGRREVRRNFENSGETQLKGYFLWNSEQVMIESRRKGRGASRVSSIVSSDNGIRNGQKEASRCAFRSRSLNWMALYAAEIERQRTFACLCPLPLYSPFSSRAFVPEDLSKSSDSQFF